MIGFMMLHEIKLMGFPVRKLSDDLMQLGGKASCKDQAKADLTYGGETFGAVFWVG